MWHDLTLLKIKWIRHNLFYYYKFLLLNKILGSLVLVEGT